MKATHNGKDVHVSFVDDGINWALISSNEDGTKKFKVDIEELQDYKKADLNKLVKQLTKQKKGDI